MKHKSVNLQVIIVEAIMYKILTPNSIMRASIILPMTVIKSKVFHGSLKKF